MGFQHPSQDAEAARAQLWATAATWKGGSSMATPADFQNNPETWTFMSDFPNFDTFPEKLLVRSQPQIVYLVMLGLATDIIFHARPRLLFSNLLSLICQQIPCLLINPLQTHSLTWNRRPKIKKDEQPCLRP